MQIHHPPYQQIRFPSHSIKGPKQLFPSPMLQPVNVASSYEGAFTSQESLELLKEFQESYITQQSSSTCKCTPQRCFVELLFITLLTLPAGHLSRLKYPCLLSIFYNARHGHAHLITLYTTPTFMRPPTHMTLFSGNTSTRVLIACTRSACARFIVTYFSPSPPPRTH